MNNVAIVFALGAAVSWASTQVFSKAGLQRMDLIHFASIRPLFALLFIVPYGFLTGGFSNPGLVFIGIAVLAGIMDAFLGSMLYLYAVKKSSAHESASLANTAPFWGVVTAVLFLGEEPRLIVFIAAFLVVLGAYFLVTRRGEAAIDHSFRDTLPALGAGVLWGVAETVPAKYCLSQGMSPISYQLVMVITAGISWNILAVVRGKSIFTIRYPWRDLGIALFTGFTGFFLGWILWLTGLELAPASLLAPVRGSMTLFAFLLSMLILRERPTIRSAVGVAFTFSGVFLVSVIG